MKQIINLGQLLIILSLVLSSCGSSKKDTANMRLGKMEVEIPAELKDKPEVVEYIEGMSQVADQYALMIDDMLEEVGEYEGVKQEDLSIMDQIKLTKVTAEVAIRSAEILGKWAGYQDKRDNLEEQLSDEELEALAGVWKRFEARIMQIETRHSEVFDKEDEDS
ncbi:MAG: hypothetical protein JEZ14_08540 [Marinilabiliaceae bacterium]|nr:hypothetical protein [Marinilabiliaceae bacterium]